MRLASLCLLLGLCACQARLPAAGDDGVADRLADAAAATTPTQGDAPSQELDAVAAKVEALRAQWQERLTQPASLGGFYTPDAAQRALVERAQADGFAQTLAERLTLEQVLAAAFGRNPRIAAARGVLSGTVEQYAQVAYLDTIQRQYVSFLRASRTGLGPTVPMDGVAARFPFPGTLELKAALVRHAIEGAQAAYDGVVRDVLVEVRVTYAKHVWLGAALRTTEQVLQYLRQLESSARSKLAAGTTPKAHVLQAQVEIARLQTELVTLAQQRETTRAMLDTLMDLPPETPLAEPEPAPARAVAADLEARLALACEAQPDVHRAAAMVRRLATMIELAEQTAYPDLSAGLAYMEDVSPATLGTDKAREPFSTRPKVMPNPWFGTQEAYLREVRERRRAAQAQLDAARSATAFRVEEASVDLTTAERVHALYRDVQIAQAEQAYRDAASGYTADRVGYLEVIEALRRWLQFQLDAERALRDIQVAQARLEGAMGAPLDRLAK